jgi:phage-related protein
MEYLFWYTAMSEKPPELDACFYRTQAGNEPVRDWLATLPRDQKRMIGTEIKTIQLGWPLGMPLVRKLERGLWEARVNLGDTTARVLFTVIGTQMALLHGFIKKSQKTPTIELDTARQRKTALERHQQ